MTPVFVKNQTPLEVFQTALREGWQPVPLANLLGFRLTEIEKGRAVVDLEAGDQHANILGTLHGGVMATVADSAMGLAAASTLEAGERTTTVDLAIHFFRPLKSGRLRAVAGVVKDGRTLVYVECDLTDDAGRLVARASSTCMTLRDAE